MYKQRIVWNGEITPEEIASALEKNELGMFKPVGFGKTLMIYSVRTNFIVDLYKLLEIMLDLNFEFNSIIVTEGFVGITFEYMEEDNE